jgi:ubiquitin-conjugating enzyme E2 G1
MAIKRLQMEYNQILNDPNYFYSIEPDKKNFLKWNILLIGPPETIFEGIIIKCIMEFPKEYPNKPPSFKFIDNLFHPNIYTDGNVCISILHEGADVYGYEGINERWNPSHSVNSIIMSIISMLNSPNFESPANVDASKLWREDFYKYKNIIYKLVAKNN